MPLAISLQFEIIQVTLVCMIQFSDLIWNISGWCLHSLFWLWYSLKWDLQERFSLTLSGFIMAMHKSSRSVLFSCPLHLNARCFAWRKKKKKKRFVSEISAEMTRKYFWRLIKVGLKVNTNLLKERILNYYLACYIPSGLPKQHSIGLFHWATKASGFWPRLTLGRWVALNTVVL